MRKKCVVKKELTIYIIIDSDGWNGLEGDRTIDEEHDTERDVEGHRCDIREFDI